MGLFSRFKNKAVTVTKHQMFEDKGSGFFAWNGNVYKSDIVRASIRPKVRAIGKTTAKHIRKDHNGIKVNPEPFMRILLEEPNPLMTMQQLLERTITHLELNNNAFIFIERDEYKYPTGLYPINSSSVELISDDNGYLFYRFFLKGGKNVTFKHEDVIHVSKDYNDNDYFGENNAEALAPLMEIVTTADQGIVKAIKNSNVIKWLLKFNQTMRPEDIEEQTKKFTQSFLSSESETTGAAGIDAKFDAIQVDPKDYVPHENQMKNTTQRIYAYFNTNEKIVTSSFNENEWISYFESVIEADIVQLSNLFTKKLFTKKERAFGNRIYFEASNLEFASLATKMQYVSMGIDRGYLNRNEGREVFKLAPIEGGDEYIHRLDLGNPSETKSDQVKGGE